MVKVLHTTLVILGVFSLIYNTYALERKYNHETDFYFDDVESGFNKSFSQNSANHNKDKLIPQSMWSKEIQYTDEKEKDNIHNPTSSDDSLSDISSWDMKKLLTNILPLLQSLNKHKANPDGKAFEMKDNARLNQLVSTPEKNQPDPLKTNLLQTGPIEGNSNENVSKPSDSSIYISKDFKNLPIKSFHDSKLETEKDQTSADATVEQTVDSPENQSPDAMPENNQEDIPKPSIRSESENNKSTNEIDSNEKRSDEVPRKETTPLTYAVSDQEPVIYPFDESFHKNTNDIKRAFFSEEAIPVYTDKWLISSFKNIPERTSDSSTNLHNLTKQEVNQPSNENLATKYFSNLEDHQESLPSSENSIARYNRPTNDDILKNSEIYRSPNVNVGITNSSSLENYTKNPSSNEENNFYLNQQTEVYPQLNIAETISPQNSFETESFSNIPKVISNESGKDADSESVLLEKESTYQNQLYTKNDDVLANDPMSIQQADALYEDYGSGEDPDSDDGSDNEDSDSDDNSDYEDYLNEHASYNTGEDIKTSDFAKNETQNATQAPETISPLFTNSSFDLPPYSRNETVKDAFENPPRRYNSILEYIYSVSNNPFFLSLRKQNNQAS